MEKLLSCRLPNNGFVDLYLDDIEGTSCVTCYDRDGFVFSCAYDPDFMWKEYIARRNDDGLKVLLFGFDTNSVFLGINLTEKNYATWVFSPLLVPGQRGMVESKVPLLFEIKNIARVLCP